MKLNKNTLEIVQDSIVRDYMDYVKANVSMEQYAEKTGYSLKEARYVVKKGHELFNARLLEECQG